MKGLLAKLRSLTRGIPPAAWLLGALVAAVLERIVGTVWAYTVGLSNLPSIFGLSLIFDKPYLIPSLLAYLIPMYLVPTYVVARLTRGWVPRVLGRFSFRTNVLIHLALFYLVLHVWGNLDAYRLRTLQLLGVFIILTTSLNLVNGWMGEFSVSVIGFMAVGAYVSSVIMVWAFANDDVFGPAIFPPALAPVGFPIALILGGLATAVTALAVAIPSFRTRGDYLAIITLAYLLIVKSAIENLEVIGGPRGFMGQPTVANLTVVFLWTVIALWTIHNYVTSTYGKATSAVRDNESAAEAMTVDTRWVKIVAFLSHAFWAGVAGGLFAHIMGYINPGMFGFRRLADVLAMLYLGGLSSISGSILGTVLIQFLSEILRPLELAKWMVIPVILILVMVRRPRGLLGFREVTFSFLSTVKEEVEDASAGN